MPAVAERYRPVGFRVLAETRCSMPVEGRPRRRLTGVGFPY